MQRGWMMREVYGREVARCPVCKVSIGDEHPYTWCASCGKTLPDSILMRIPGRRSTVTEPGETTALIRASSIVELAVAAGLALAALLRSLP